MRCLGSSLAGYEMGLIHTVFYDMKVGFSLIIKVLYTCKKAQKLLIVIPIFLANFLVVVCVRQKGKRKTPKGTRNG